MFGKHSEIVNSVGNIDEELVEYIIKFYDKNPLLSKELVVPYEIDKDLLSDYLEIKVSSYQKGDIKKLLDLARDNAKVALDEKLENIKRSDIEGFIEEDLFSYKVINNNKLYKIIDILDNKAHKILVLDNNIMVPYVSEFIEKKDDIEKIIYMKLPDNML